MNLSLVANCYDVYETKLSSISSKTQAVTFTNRQFEQSKSKLTSLTYTQDTNSFMTYEFDLTNRISFATAILPGVYIQYDSYLS